MGVDDTRKHIRKQAVQQLATLFVKSFAGKVILWSVFLLLVVVLLLFLGVLEERGAAADWLAAGGAIFAASVALNIATGDRQERRTERDAAGLAQMRLVKIDAHDRQDSSEPDVQLRVDVTNYGERPILQVLMLTAEVESVSAGTFKLSDRVRPSELRIIPTVSQPQLPSQSFLVGMANPEGDRWLPRSNEAHRQKYANGLRAKIQCIDADGQHWILSNDGDPQRHLPQPGPPVWQRLWKHRKQAAAELRSLLAPSLGTRIALTVAVAIAFAFVWLWNWNWLCDLISMLFN